MAYSHALICEPDYPLYLLPTVFFHRSVPFPYLHDSTISCRRVVSLLVYLEKSSKMVGKRRIILNRILYAQCISWLCCFSCASERKVNRKRLKNSNKTISMVRLVNVQAQPPVAFLYEKEFSEDDVTVDGRECVLLQLRSCELCSPC